jgi:dUTP pyrophosphatase
MDDNTKRVKIATHCTFDEAGMTVPPAEQSLASKALQQVGFNSKCDHDPTPDCQNEPNETAIDSLKVKLLSDKAKLPVRATTGSAGYDVYSPIATNIDPGQRVLIPLDLQLQPPRGTYIQLASRSGMSINKMTDVQAGVIDSDFTGNVTVVLHNSSPNTVSIDIGDRIAQFIIIPITTPACTIVSDIESTARADKGFGSTGTSII